MSDLDEARCKELRKRVFITGYKGGHAHLASCFSAIEILYTLYMKGILKYDINNPYLEERDRFVLSKGHSGLALFSVLELAGIISKSEMESYLKCESGIGGEPNLGDALGIEASTGSLGHGLSMAVGMALAQKNDGKGSRTFVLIGDGECQEGTMWEAAMSASSFSLDNLIVVMDYNKLQKTNRVDETLKYVEWADKWRTFGWNVLITDGHDVEQLRNVLGEIQMCKKPTIVMAETIKGRGVSIMENSPKWHFKMPTKKELKYFIEELGISEEELEV
ncbi:transketolase [Butyrivibrio sp. XPD2002]|uniref:transketolase n=1 Tax=Butyrivibrio sp. XPD2002 TaxID=1280665 RepID=UPI0003F79E62|nr:transketolase [Butyrivibrio sp. XPD2002]